MDKDIERMDKDIERMDKDIERMDKDMDKDIEREWTKTLKENGQRH